MEVGRPATILNSSKKKVGFINENRMLTSADIALTEGIRTVGRDEVNNLAAITADAFLHDPFNNWMFKSQKRKHQMFRAMARRVYAPNGFCQILQENGEDFAATMWMMPGGSLDTPLMGALSLGIAFALDDGLAGMKRGLATSKAMELHHPKEPHAYLFTVGVKGDGRGRGLGRRLIEPVLAACDRTGTVVYLENSNPANTPVYNSLGFESVSLFHPVPGSPPLEGMKRQPRG